jgi:hypothetical protein
MPTKIYKEKSTKEKAKSKLDLTSWNAWKETMKKPKELFEIYKDNQTSTKWSSISWWVKYKTKEERQPPIKRVWIGEWRVCNSKRKNSNKKSRDKLAEPIITKLCSERLDRKDNNREERQWLANNKPWESSRLWLAKEKN